MKKIFTVLLFIIASISALAQIKTISDRPIKNTQGLSTKLPAINNVATDFSGVEICLDAFNVPNNPLPPRSQPTSSIPYKIDQNGNISRIGTTQQGLFGFTDKMWSTGSVITVYLSNKASQTLRNKVMQYSKEWEQYANIHFNFIDNYALANIKVTFDQNGQSWSWLGRDVLLNVIFTNTMNLGWLNDESKNSEIRRVVLHEFGHALGLGHEHQSPASPLIFVKSFTYAYFLEKNKWSAAEVDLNVINKYGTSNTIFGTYDPFSIMHYPIPARLLQGEQRIERTNYELSAKDKEYAGLWYPFPPTPANAAGNLLTTDDCDNIYFTVEYNVVPADQVEFRLEFGQTNGNMVSWWKQIGIPLTNNREKLMEILNHSLIPAENIPIAEVQIPLNEIEKNKGIRFWKAKAFGVHTPIGYQWNVLPALPGGSRVRLTWRKDSCL